MFLLGLTLPVHDLSYLDSAAFIKAKINNSGILALGKYPSCL